MCPAIQSSVERAMQQRIKVALTLATMAIHIAVISSMAAGAALANPANHEDERRNRSRFEYHDGRPEEKRPYRRPDLDADPTNLKLEEMRERINRLEERLELLERNSIHSK